MKIAAPDSTAPPRVQQNRVPYANKEYAAALWQQIDHWRKNNYYRKSWNWVALGEKQSTLKAKLYNTLGYLKKHGTDEQRELCEQLTFNVMGNEYLLSRVRPGKFSFAGATNINALTPADHPESNIGGAAFAGIRAGVIKYVTEVEYTGEESVRMAYEVTGIYLSESQKEELEQIIDEAGDFGRFVRAGTRGSIRIFPLSPAEKAQLNALKQEGGLEP